LRSGENGPANYQDFTVQLMWATANV
jgi:hypothetical protein